MMKKLPIEFVFFLMCFLFVTHPCEAQDTLNNQSRPPNGAFISSCKIVKIKRHKSVYDIYAISNNMNIRILSPKEKCTGLEKINTGMVYDLILCPYFIESDSIIVVSIPNFIVIDDIPVSVCDNYSMRLYYSLNLKGLYYDEIKNTLNVSNSFKCK